MEEWKSGRVEEWKRDGRVEGGRWEEWKRDGRVEGWMWLYKEAQSRMNVLQQYQDVYGTEKGYEGGVWLQKDVQSNRMCYRHIKMYVVRRRAMKDGCCRKMHNLTEFATKKRTSWKHFNYWRRYCHNPLN